MAISHVVALAFLAGVAGNQIEDFEHADKGLYQLYGPMGDNLVFAASGAHAGKLGATFPTSQASFYVRSDVPTRPGRIYRAFVRSTDDSARIYVGVGASELGTWSMVAAYNTNTLVLQDNAFFGFGALAETPFQFQANVWYQMELEWSLLGAMTVRLWDEGHERLLAVTDTVQVTTQPGVLAVRGFSITGEAHLDQIMETILPVAYCTAKVNSLGCLPVITTLGESSANAADGFVVAAAPVLNNKAGMLLHSLTGRAALPFQGGTLCLAPPVLRTPASDSGGSPPPFSDCSGTWQIDLNAFAAGKIGGNPDALLRQPGTYVHCQWWGRDPGFPPPDATALSGALQYVVGP